jgi:collagenase-like PrtC family protease
MRSLPELICPAGSLPALKAAVDNGADAVYLGFKNDTNARNFAGLNFDAKSMADGIRYAHAKGREVLLAINTFAQAGRVADWERAVDDAVAQGVDAIILADVGLLDYAARRHPQQRLHLSVQGSATSYEAINFCQHEFGIRRAVLPRVLTLAQVEQVVTNTTVEIEVFGFGSLCVMNEGRCWLSSYACGESPNTVGACSPAKYVKWDKQARAAMETRLNGILIDRFADDEPAGYPTLCKGRFEVGRDLLRPGRAGEPQRHCHPAGNRPDRRARHQGRRPPAQPSLCSPGDPHPARGARFAGQRTRRLPGKAGLAGRSRQGLRRQSGDAGRLQPAVALKDFA